MITMDKAMWRRVGWLCVAIVLFAVLFTGLFIPMGPRDSGDPSTLDAGNTAWMLTASALVLFMTPALSSVYLLTVEQNRFVASSLSDLKKTCTVDNLRTGIFLWWYGAAPQHHLHHAAMHDVCRCHRCTVDHLWLQSCIWRRPWQFHWCLGCHLQQFFPMKANVLPPARPLDLLVVSQRWHSPQSRFLCHHSLPALCRVPTEVCCLDPWAEQRAQLF